MPTVQEVAVVLLCGFLRLTFTVGLNHETKFTKKPQDTVYARLGSDVVFQWAWVFGDAQDWSNFEQIIWGGETDKHGNIGNKYITIGNDLKLWFNPSLPDYVKSRANWTGIVNRAGCRQKFILRNVTRLDETTYGCTAVMYGETIKSGPIRLVVLIPPKITSRSNLTVDVAEGEQVTLRCEVTGNPVPTVSWMRYGEVLLNSNTMLQIPDIQRKNAGNYTCTATNQAGHVSEGFVVRVVRYRPYINRNASSSPRIKSSINHVTTLKCAVDANPPANLFWLKNGDKILTGVNSTHNLSTLTLIPKTAGDFGVYWCYATNNRGITSYVITVEQI